jgi:hypothetical protein
LAREVVLFHQRKSGIVGAAGSHAHELGLRLTRLPPGEHVGVDLLVDDPLLARMMQAEVARPRPGGEMKNLVEPLIRPGVERAVAREVGLPGARTDDMVSGRLERRDQPAPEKARGSRNQDIHRRSGFTGK